MAPRHAFLPAADGTFVPVPARDHLSLVKPVYVTFADGAALRQTGPLWRREHRRTPVGLAHAAHLHSPQTLCGAPLESLEAFGRSRHPFEGFDSGQRCPACDAATGRPAS